MDAEKEPEIIKITEDGGVTKKILKQGEGECPQKGFEVDMLYIGRLLDGTQFDSNQDSDNPFQFTLGQGQVIKGWDFGVATMKKGEKAILTCSAENAYGEAGSPPKIPPNSTLEFEVELLDFREKEKSKWDYSDEERIKMAQDFKLEGNEHFKKQEYSLAKKQYEQAVDYVDLSSNDQGKLIAQIKYSSYLNLAACNLKLKEESDCISNCDKALALDDKSVKAYYRKAEAYFSLGEFEKSIEQCEKLLTIEADNKDAKLLIGKNKEKQISLKKKEKKVWGGLFKEEYYQKETSMLSDPSNPHVFFDVKIGNGEPQRIEFELFKHIVPKTAENFRALCTGEKGKTAEDKPLHYKNTVFHRLIAGFMIQGGDFENANGTGGQSIYGAKFEDENFKVKHNERGLLSMANAGPKTNGSQFFILFKDAPHLDGKHVVFGKVVKNIELLETLEAADTEGEKPREPITIVDCGEVLKQ